MKEAQGFTYEIRKGAIRLTGCTLQDAKEVTVPAIIEGMSVTSLGGGLLWGKNTLSLKLPDSITSVSPSLLSGCYSLKIIEIADTGGGERFYRSLKTAIGERSVKITGGKKAFALLLGSEGRMNEALKWLRGAKLSFPEECVREYFKRRAVFVLERAAADDDVAALIAAESLKPLTAAQTDRLIEAAKRADAGEAHAHLLGYKEAHFGFADVFSALSREFDADPFSPAQIKKRFGIRISGEACAVSGYLGGERDIFIPERMGRRPITSLCAHAFSAKKRQGARPVYSQLERIELNGVSSLGEACFEGCAALESVNAPNVTAIPERCFADCGRLNAFDFSEIEYIGAHAFENCVSLQAADLSAVSDIGEWAFYGCGGLNELIVPHKTVTLPELCFARCAALERLSLPEGLITTGKRSFFECTALKDISFAGSVRRIDWQSFSGCSGISRLEIPGTVKEIGNLAFYYCIALTELILHEGIEAIEWGAFSNCQTLERVSLPHSIRRIDSYAFSECYALREIHIPPEITQIEPMVFSDCRLVRIYGRRDSYAREYAWIYGIPFIEDKDML